MFWYFLLILSLSFYTKGDVMMSTAKIFQYLFSISGTVILGFIYYGMFKGDSNSKKTISKNEKNRSNT
ncbi:MarC family protein [Metabacillus mangrovi]|uniref:MarC family protein n=1 Tax=Metabacillus mangrovi TaxID=1491830 RepID=UPI0030C7DBD7